MKVIVSGGCGYVGSWLVRHLLADGHKVTVYDAMYFGDGFLPKDNLNLTLINGDIRDIEKWAEACTGQDAVIHLACISNDVSCQLDEALSRAVNIDAFEPLVIAAKNAGVRRFIYCSSSSVYGVSYLPDVFEDTPCVPMTLYNASKAECEKRLWPHHSNDFVCVVIRPATVCGYAPRQRFDLTVNVMTNHAVRKGIITVFGGMQKRPNLHIQNMADVYKLLLLAPDEKIAGQTFNVGRQNMTVMEIAETISRVVSDQMHGGKEVIPIVKEPSQDNRSYHINSDKIARVLGFTPQLTVEDAIRDLCVQFKKGNFQDSLTNPVYTNVVQLVEKHGFGVAA
ncbi:MAG: NAD(P)-dependent oxidoreductase [Sulfuricaulis sp.]|nr:NAD(P)-dependent oxidoreductase [Sulfuricaulis sp.]